MKDIIDQINLLHTLSMAFHEIEHEPTNLLFDMMLVTCDYHHELSKVNNNHQYESTYHNCVFGTGDLHDKLTYEYISTDELESHVHYTNERDSTCFEVKYERITFDTVVERQLQYTILYPNIDLYIKFNEACKKYLNQEITQLFIDIRILDVDVLKAQNTALYGNLIVLKYANNTSYQFNSEFIDNVIDNIDLELLGFNK